MVAMQAPAFSKQQGHAISRTAELLSVARTSLRILQQQKQDSISPDLRSLNAKELSLHSSIKPKNDAIEALDEASLTLKLLDSTLKDLSNLVKRRGATNDPTEEINRAISSFHNYSKGILEVIQNSLPQSAVLSPYDDVVVRASSQRIKHYEMVANVLKSRVEKRMEEFKGIMEVRGNIIKEQTLRRKQLLDVTKNRNKNNMNSLTQSSAQIKPPRSGGIRPTPTKRFAPVSIDRKAKSQMNSPLFTVPYNQSKSAHASPSMRNRSQNGTMNGKSNSINVAHTQHIAPNPYSAPKKTGYGGTPAGYGGQGGYGGGFNNGNMYSSNNQSTGMRRRGGGSTSTLHKNGYDPYQQQEESKIHDSNSVQAQIQMNRDNRQTQSRLESARQAEKTLAELTTMFSKMSTLIHSQGETLVKIEDDVEAAMDHVEAGKDEIFKLYEWTKGNRALIIKVFAILIFFIIFMRFYG